jgi:SPP1 gp7 family putative phage head morphogenesis protein
MDKGHQFTEDILSKMEREISGVYRQAEHEVADKLNDYLKRYNTKDQIWQGWVADGKKTQDEYTKWKAQQILMDDRWKDMRESLAQDFHNANGIASSIINGYKPEVYALNHNYATYQIEKGIGASTSYTLYDRQTVERLMRDDPQMLPSPGKKVSKAIADGKDIAWNQKQIQSVMTQAILQGESIPKIATRLAKEVGDKDRKAAVRNARTMTTGAENAGRVDGYKRAQEMGINLRQQWVATLDDRTRHEHRMLDGKMVEVGEPFEVEGYEIRYPGDPQAEAFLVYNCRCTLIAALKGFEHDLSDTSLRYDDNLKGMSYEEWLEAPSTSNPILLPEEKAEAIRQSYINEYRGFGGGSTEMSSVTTKEPEMPDFDFTPAQTIGEAEEYISQYVDKNQFGAVGVSYKGISVDVANEINRTIGRFYETFNVDKFGGIIAPAGNTKYGKMIQDATAAYSDVRRSFFLNRSSLKNMDVATKAFANEYNAVANILAHPENYDLTKASPRLIRVLENSAVSGRGTIPQTVEEAINHELGHSLEKQIKKSDLWDDVVSRMGDYNKGLSGYACENTSEYIAESFCSYMKGEGKTDPVLAQIFESMKR